jgi:hypothetical protein
LETDVAQIRVSSDNIERIRDRLTLWLSAYGQPGSVKTKLLLEHFQAEFPNTCEYFSEFIKDKDTDRTYAYWHLLDYLFSELTKDLTDCSEDEIKQLSARMGEETPRSVAETFSGFLTWLSISGKGVSVWEYRFNRREQPGVINEAYSIKQFSTAAYCVFNKSMWMKNGLVAKAAGNRVYADLWVFTALNFICALRVGDLMRLPSPALPIERAEVHQLALSGKFPDAISRTVTRDLVARVQLLELKPSKTAKRGNVPNLKLFIPESLIVPLGLIIAVSLAHHPEIKPGNSFVFPSDNYRITKNFFGNEFTDAIGRRKFVPRRCNKAYLQGIEAVGGTDNPPGKPKGYMLAALARSHKSGVGTLAATTDIYLKDARFAGYTPEFIICEMFERGVFSFIPAVLLSAYAGEQYFQLPVRAQTTLIKQLRITAPEIEKVAEFIEQALERSRRAVNDMLSADNSITANVFTALQNIASGNAPSKQDEYLCLMSAAGRICPAPDRGCCLGCGYEIYTKSAMHTLMKEYVRLSSARLTAEHNENVRLAKILETAVLPAVFEILTAARSLYPGNDNSELMDILEKGMEYANHSTRISDTQCQPYSQDRFE